MLTEEQVLAVLHRADILSGWQLLPPDEEQAGEKARAWAEALDRRLTYAEAIEIVEKHSRTQRQPLAIADLNEPIERRYAPGAPSSTGALQRMRQEQRGAIPCPPDLDLHRFRGVTPKYRTQAAQQQHDAAVQHAHTERGRASHLDDADDRFHEQVQELAYPAASATHPPARPMGRLTVEAREARR